MFGRWLAHGIVLYKLHLYTKTLPNGLNLGLTVDSSRIFPTVPVSAHQTKSQALNSAFNRSITQLHSSW